MQCSAVIYQHTNSYFHPTPHFFCNTTFIIDDYFPCFLSPTPPANSDVSQNDSPFSLSTTPSYDADHRYSRSQLDRLVSRKSMPHFQQDSHPTLRNLSCSALESLGVGGKWNGVGLDTKVDNKLAYGLTCVQPSSEDEGFCPTCLEEYTTENPKITARCPHHFHLGCIYEWLERSESCPVCGKEMESCESP